MDVKGREFSAIAMARFFFYQGRKKSAGIHRERNKYSLKKNSYEDICPELDSSGIWFPEEIFF